MNSTNINILHKYKIKDYSALCGCFFCFFLKGFCDEIYNAKLA